MRILILLSVAASAWCASYYTVRPDDPKAVYVDGPGAGGDDTAMLQQAIDKVQQTTRQGVVFLAAGRYRVTKTLYIWPGIRVIGYGATRPVLALPPHTPGFEDKDRENLMVFFAGGRRPGNAPQDAGAGTFYSAISNVDLEIGEGNSGAVGVRAHYAQHCFLAHMDFGIGPGIAGIHEAGNVAEDVHFHGGRFGIWSTPIPARRHWPGW